MQDCFAMSKQQAEGVLNLSLRRLTSLEGKKLQEENDVLSARCVFLPTAPHLPRCCGCMLYPNHISQPQHQVLVVAPLLHAQTDV